METADVPKRFQKRLLKRVLSLLDVPNDTDQCPVYTAAVTGDQFFESIQIARLRSGHQTSVWVNLLRFHGALFGECRKRMFDAVYVPGFNVRGRPEAHLQCVQEVVKRRHDYCLQNVLFCKAVATKFIDILIADIRASTCKFERKVQKRLGLLGKIGLVMVQHDLVGVLR